MNSRHTTIRIDADTDDSIDRLKAYYGGNMSEVIRKSIKVLEMHAAAKERGAEIHVIGDGLDTIIEVI